MNLAHLFPGISQQGSTFIQQVGGPMAGLSGEADIMMISGVGAADAVPAPDGVSVVGMPTQTLTGQLQYPITLGKWTLPLWQWLVIAALLGGAGGYYLGRR